MRTRRSGVTTTTALATEADVARAAEEFDGVLLSPGPGTPERAGASIPLVHACAAARTPLLGVCLGHQAIGVAFGGTVDRAPELLHGKTSTVHHANAGVLKGLPDPFTATRYHSLTILPETVPAELEVIARTDGGVIMGVRHVELPIHGVQFHPESILTEGGHRMLANWLAYCGTAPAEDARPPTWRTRSPAPWLPLRREVQRDPGAEGHGGSRRRALTHHGVRALTAVRHVAALVQHACPAERPQPRLGVGPEHPGQVRHHELVAPRHLDLNHRVLWNDLTGNGIGADHLARRRGAVDTRPAPTW